MEHQPKQVRKFKAPGGVQAGEGGVVGFHESFYVFDTAKLTIPADTYSLSDDASHTFTLHDDRAGQNPLIFFIYTGDVENY